MALMMFDRSYVDHSLLVRAIPADPSQVLQPKACPSSILSLSQCFPSHSMAAQESTEMYHPGHYWHSRLHVEPEPIASSSGGNPFSVAQQQTCRLCILSCSLSLSSLFSRSSLFPFVVCPVSDLPAHPSS